MTRKERKKSKPTRPRRIAVLMGVIVLGFTGACLIQHRGLELPFISSNKQRHSQAERASGRKWAESLELPGLPNLHKVSENLYRGSQPTTEGMRQLEKLGVKMVVNLRSSRSDRDEIEGTALAYEHINTTTLSTETKDVVRFLKIVTDKDRLAVFVHCHRGAERTGVMCAAYRIVVQGWTKEEAIEEMTEGGFASRTIKKNLLDYIRRMNVMEIKRRSGLDK